MSLINAYYYAERARNKLRKEAASPDADLRRVACLGNLFDALSSSIDQYEREKKNTRQESWFNEMISDVELDQDDATAANGSIVDVNRLDGGRQPPEFVWIKKPSYPPPPYSPPATNASAGPGAAAPGSSPLPQIGVL
ncbi:hypothetical protein TRICI_002480 [Trichomonascus ciferrii]|uniref:Uncharacterized protein n=1 Tax=Trichomonascus ciferrii TaxID=44093 RepID=A0A642V6Q2_9ASCO|nr:hypothetical protein TRICI_002480 [Trichomonascus ciferrii]